MKKPIIFVTNDDGIDSPGLHAAVAAVRPLGEVVVVAPLTQQSSKGRGLGCDPDTPFVERPMEVAGGRVDAYAFDGTPAHTVLHALDVVGPGRWPDLVVSGINYGENLGNNVTISGTVGAAMEAASRRVPALAVSLQTDHVFSEQYGEVDWRVAVHFTAAFAARMLEGPLLPDVDVLNVVIPEEAGTETPWRLTRQSRLADFSTRVETPSLDSRIRDTQVGIYLERADVEPGSDIEAVLFDRVVSVTPLSLDCTSRADFAALDRNLR